MQNIYSENYQTFKEFLRRQTNGRYNAFMDWKTQHCNDVHFELGQSLRFFNGNSQRVSRIFMKMRRVKNRIIKTIRKKGNNTREFTLTDIKIYYGYLGFALFIVQKAVWNRIDSPEIDSCLYSISGFMTKVTLQCSWVCMVFPINGAGSTGYPYGKKGISSLTSHHIWIQDELWI